MCLDTFRPPRLGGTILTYGQEEITNIMGYVDGKTHVSEMESIAETNQGQADDVVSNELLEVLSPLLQTELLY